MDPDRLQANFALVTGTFGAQVIEDFYAELVRRCTAPGADPSLRAVPAMFPASMVRTRREVFLALGAVADHLDRLGDVTPHLEKLGRWHYRFGAEPAHYEAVAATFIDILQYFTLLAGQQWTPDLEDGWPEALGVVATVMIGAGKKIAATQPRWWDGKVTGSERASRDVAILTVDPGRPLPYLPGQHIPVETPALPNVWTNLSPAHAPNGDNLISLHVRLIAGGLGSLALFAVKPGDPVRLGPAEGDFVRTGSGRDVVMIGGGVGIAPLCAMLGQIAALPDPPHVHVIFGAREASGLYHREALEKLAAGSAWLTVTCAVTHDPRWEGEQGWLSDVAARIATRAGSTPWKDREIYTAGSAQCVAAVVAMLREQDVPGEQIRSQAFGGKIHKKTEEEAFGGRPAS